MACFGNVILDIRQLSPAAGWFGADPLFVAKHAQKRGGEKRTQKMNAKGVQRQLLDTFCVHFLGPLFAPLFWSRFSPQKGSSDKAAVQASWLDSIIPNCFILFCSRTIGRASVVLAVHRFLNTLVKQAVAHVASVE